MKLFKNTVQPTTLDLLSGLMSLSELEAFVLVGGTRFLSYEDIIPMKLEAMATRGVKKDFWDLAYLLDLYSLDQMLI